MGKNRPYLLGGFVSLFVLLMVGSLLYGWLDPFFWAAQHAQVQGIDYFSLPKAYQNLLQGKSVFDTWGTPMYGPYATWYLAHPAFAVWVGSWFSYSSPWVSYALFVGMSILVTALSAWFLSRFALTVRYKTWMFVLLLCGFPVYWTLYVGNIQQFFVLSLALVHAGLLGLAFPRNETWSRYARGLLLAGLLISFFSKPLVILMIPLLLITKLTRVTTIKALVVYGVVSLLFIVVPPLNPEGLGLLRVIEIGLDPAYIQQHLNIYNNNFVVNREMKDNAMHWFNLVAQSDFYLNHIEVYSFPVFFNTLLDTRLPGWLYKLPILLSLLCSIGVFFVKDPKRQAAAALWLSGAFVCTFFLSYNTVWEYQYTAMMPFIAILALLQERGIISKSKTALLFACAVLIYLPSLFIFIGAYKPEMYLISLMRSTKVIPTLIIFLITLATAFQLLRKERKNSIV